METYESLLATLALTMGASWASGINLYAALLVLGIGGSTGNIDLPPDLQVLADPMVIGAAGLMYFVEFFVDKTPGVDTGWDTLHTFIRIPAGAMLAAGAVGDVTPVLEVAAGIMGGTLAATSHATKAGTRALINTSPEPFTNWGASLTEDLMVFAGLWTALNYPLLFLVLLAVFIGLAIWLLPKIWRVIKAILSKIGGWLGMTAASESATTSASPPNSPTSPPTTSPTTETRRLPGYNEEQLKQIEALQLLRESGKLSEEEFTRTREKILSS